MNRSVFKIILVITILIFLSTNVYAQKKYYISIGTVINPRSAEVIVKKYKPSLERIPIHFIKGKTGNRECIIIAVGEFSSHNEAKRQLTNLSGKIPSDACVISRINPMYYSSDEISSITTIRIEPTNPKPSLLKETPNELKDSKKLTKIDSFDSSTFSSQLIEVSIKGIDDGVNTNRQRDYAEAVMNAKLQAIERVGVEIKSLTIIKDFQLQSDIIESKSRGILVPGFRVVDMGYQTDGTYQIVLSGKVKSPKESVDSKEIRYAKSLIKRGRKTKAKEIIDSLIKEGSNDKVVEEAMYIKILYGLSEDEKELLQRLVSYYPNSKYVRELKTFLSHKRFLIWTYEDYRNKYPDDFKQIIGFKWGENLIVPRSSIPIEWIYRGWKNKGKPEEITYYDKIYSTISWPEQKKLDFDVYFDHDGGNEFYLIIEYYQNGKTSTLKCRSDDRESDICHTEDDLELKLKYEFHDSKYPSERSAYWYIYYRYKITDKECKRRTLVDFYNKFKIEPEPELFSYHKWAK